MDGEDAKAGLLPSVLQRSPSIQGRQGGEPLLAGGDAFRTIVPLHDRQKGSFFTYFVVRKKGEFRPILDLCCLQVDCPQDDPHANYQAVHCHQLKGLLLLSC